MFPGVALTTLLLLYYYTSMSAMATAASLAPLIGPYLVNLGGGFG